MFVIILSFALLYPNPLVRAQDEPIEVVGEEESFKTRSFYGLDYQSGVGGFSGTMFEVPFMKNLYSMPHFRFAFDTSAYEENGLQTTKTAGVEFAYLIWEQNQFSLFALAGFDADWTNVEGVRSDWVYMTQSAGGMFTWNLPDNIPVFTWIFTDVGVGVFAKARGQITDLFKSDENDWLTKIRFGGFIYHGIGS